MTIDIDEKAAAYIREKGGICTIKQEYIRTASEQMPHVDISYAAPDRLAGFDAYDSDGVRLYVGRAIAFKKGVVRVTCARFLWFRWLELPTYSFFGSE